jgi:predicted tellurium resistance membrane protein TerC
MHTNQQNMHVGSVLAVSCTYLLYIGSLYLSCKERFVFTESFQVTVKELEHIIEKLEKEKAELNSALNTKKANPSALK